MPETSIVIKTEDRSSAAFKTISEKVKELENRLKDLQDRQHSLSKQKANVSLDTKQAREELKKATDRFNETRDSADGLRMELAQASYDGFARELKTITQAARDTEKQIQSCEESISKAENSAGDNFGGKIFSKSTWNGVRGGLAQAGIYKMLGDSLSGVAGAFVESAIGQPLAQLGSSTLSGIASGATSGAILGLPGVIAGAAIGGISGLVNGGSQIYEARDDAFKSYYQEAYETQISEQESSLSTGSALAAQRETDKISFSTLFKDEGIADAYLSNLVEMANDTPFLYDDLTSMSKTLATYGYSAQVDAEKSIAGEKDFNYILDVLETIGDTGAALGQSTSDMSAVATALGRMKSSNKTTLEYLNILNDRGIGAVGMLADAYGVDQGAMYDMISKGQIEGGKAAEIILQAMTDSFAGSMENQAKTFSGLTSTVEGMTQELDNAMGEGYNEGRMAGLQAQRDWLSGESGEAVMEANKAIGAWKAELENSKEQYIRDAVDTMMASDEYQTAKASGDAAEMGRLIMEAKVQGMNEYNASDGAQLALESEKTLIESIRNDTSLNSEYWQAGYEKSQEFTKGLAAGISSGWGGEVDSMLIDPAGASGWAGASKKAVGIDYVPYDNFPALLHQGERVQTAVEARSERSAPTITITGNTFTIREDADVQRVASEILTQLELAGQRG